LDPRCKTPGPAGRVRVEGSTHVVNPANSAMRDCASDALVETDVGDSARQGFMRGERQGPPTTPLLPCENEYVQGRRREMRVVVRIRVTEHIPAPGAEAGAGA